MTKPSMTDSFALLTTTAQACGVAMLATSAMVLSACPSHQRDDSTCPGPASTSSTPEPEGTGETGDDPEQLPEPKV